MSVLLVAVGLFYTNQANRATQIAGREQQKLAVQQQALAAQGQVADRFAAAVGQLGQEDDPGQSKLSIRLGGVYGLQRVMLDSPPDEPAVTGVLSAFVQTHTPSSKFTDNCGLDPRDPVKGSTIPIKSPTRTFFTSPQDVYAAFSVLALRPQPTSHQLALGPELKVGIPQARLAGADLSGVKIVNSDLIYADLSRANLRGSSIIDSDLSVARLDSAQLQDASIDCSVLLNTEMNNADLSGAGASRIFVAYANIRQSNFEHSTLNGANLDADFSGSDFRHSFFTDVETNSSNFSGVLFTGAFLGGTDFSRAKGLRPAQFVGTWISSTTRLPRGFKLPAGVWRSGG